VYVAVYVDRVRRTNIYLTDTEQAALDARAAAEGSTRSEIVRTIVDRELNLSPDEQTDIDTALGAAAAELAERSRVLSGTTSTFTSPEWSSSTTTLPCWP
jgi:succinyl-CoA synthetase beta subunit